MNKNWFYYIHNKSVHPLHLVIKTLILNSETSTMTFQSCTVTDKKEKQHLRLTIDALRQSQEHEMEMDREVQHANDTTSSRWGLSSEPVNKHTKAREMTSQGIRCVEKKLKVWFSQYYTQFSQMWNGFWFPFLTLPWH